MFALTKTELMRIRMAYDRLDVADDRFYLRVTTAYEVHRKYLDLFVQCGGDSWLAAASRSFRVLKSLLN